MLRRQVMSGVISRAAVLGASATLSYKPRLREYRFLNEEVFDMYNHYGHLGVADNANKDLCDSLLDECSKLCVNELFPTYMSGDDEGCTLGADTNVKTPKGFKAGYDAICQGGWLGISSPEKYGGQGLPASIGYQNREMMATANWSLVMYPGLSGGAAQTLLAWGSDAQKDQYLPKLVEGTWSGTMCLTEPQCCTDLGQVKTKAIPQEDGTYKITGTKIFISAGEHDLTENIIHIVLARLPDSPPGTKGISLFLVPRHIVKADGSLESEKNVICSGLEKKMGIKASSTCQMSFDESVGYMIGGPNEGMKEMFTFMNAARLGTAIQGIAHAELAFQNALLYARERCSMRSLTGTKEPEKIGDPIIHYPNVRHNIFFAKAVAEAGRCFAIDLARLLDILESPKTSAEQKKAVDKELGFLTPIAKGCLTELGLEAANNGVQVFGGHGFIKGNGMEQIVRDARISTLYEGTTGIQGLDFIGRKVLVDKAAQAYKFGNKVNTLAKEFAVSKGVLGRCGRKLWMQQKQWKLGIMKIMVSAARNKDSVGSSSQDFLMMTGYITLGYYWLRMAAVAQKKVDAGQDPEGFYQSKIDMCDFYFTRVMPRCDTHLQVMTSPASAVMGPKESILDLE